MQRLKSWLLAQTQSVSHRIVFGLLAGLLFCLWGFVAFWILWERHSLLDSSRKVLEQQTISVHEQAHNLFRRAETSLIVAQHWISTHPGQDPARSPDFIALVDKLRLSSDDLIDLRMVTHDGSLRYIPDVGQTQQINVADRDYFQAQNDPKTRGLYVARPVRSRVTGKLGIPISLPVEGAGGNVAVIFAAIELERIADSFENERVKPRGTIAMIRNDGVVLFRSPLVESVIGRSIATTDSWIRQMAPVNPPGVFLLEQNPIDGLSRLVSHTPVLDFPMIVAVSAATDDILQSWRRHTLALIIVALLISSIGLLLGVTLLRSMRSEAAARRELERLMLTDPLTEVGNRRLLMQRLEEEIQRALRHQRCLTLVFLDLDHFKDINDQRGHDMGDTVLVQVAAALRSRLRQSDLVARFGGEEFVLVLAETALADALLLVEQMRATLHALDIPGLGWHITASAGLAQWQDGESGASLLRRADQALYRAKQTGRDRACVDLPA